MKLYDNSPESYYEESKSYFPRWYADIREMDAIWRVTGDMLDQIRRDILQVLDNAGIVNCDYDTVHRLEEWLDIEFSSPRTDEGRKRYLLMQLAGFGKCSRTKIKQVIKRYTGAESRVTFEIIDDQGNYCLIIDIDRGDAETFYLGDVQNILEKLIPAHIAYSTMVQNPTCIRTDIVIRRWLYNLDPCGIKPESAELYDKLLFGVEYHSSIRNYKHSFEPASESYVAGIVPEVTTVGGSATLRGIEVSEKTNAYLHEFNPAGADTIAGTMPNIVLLGRSADFGIEVGTEAEPYVYDHPRAGIVPENSVLGRGMESEVGISTESKHYFSEALPAGVVPDVAMLARGVKAEVNVQAEIGTHKKEFEPASESMTSGMTAEAPQTE